MTLAEGYVVATYAPMKRGLKGALDSVQKRSVCIVATYAPMKRGLKVDHVNGTTPLSGMVSSNLCPDEKGTESRRTPIAPLCLTL